MVIVIARLKAAAGQEATLEKLLGELAAAVRKNEPACSMYSACKGQTPGLYTVVERYQDQAALVAHGQSAHFLEIGAKMAPCLGAAPELEFLSEVS